MRAPGGPKNPWISRLFSLNVWIISSGLGIWWLPPGPTCPAMPRTGPRGDPPALRPGSRIPGSRAPDAVAPGASDSAPREPTEPPEAIAWEAKERELEAWLTTFLRERAIPLDPASIRLRHGIVTLSGNVRYLSERLEAEFWSRQVPGVRRVINHLRVIRVGSLTDLRLRRLVIRAIRYATPLSRPAIQVVVHGGRVRLSGKVGSRIQKSDLLSVVSQLRGVQAIEDGMSVAVIPRAKSPSSPGYAPERSR